MKFDYGTVEVYPEGTEKPQRGSGLNKVCEVSLWLGDKIPNAALLEKVKLPSARACKVGLLANDSRREKMAKGFRNVVMAFWTHFARIWHQ